MSRLLQFDEPQGLVEVLVRKRVVLVLPTLCFEHSPRRSRVAAYLSIARYALLTGPKLSNFSSQLVSY
jgi:hypothetical protein